MVSTRSLASTWGDGGKSWRRPRCDAGGELSAAPHPASRAAIAVTRSENAGLSRQHGTDRTFVYAGPPLQSLAQQPDLGRAAPIAELESASGRRRFRIDPQRR
jgi:hypothetical protein